MTIETEVTRGGTVFVIDDDEMVRTSVACAAESIGARAQTFASARAFLAVSALAEMPGCVVANMSLPDLDGVALIALLHKAGAPFPVVLLTDGVPSWRIVRAMKAGAMDVIEKPVRPRDITDVLRLAIDQANVLFRDRKAQKLLLRCLETLTPREREVFSLVTTGMLNKQVAWELGVSEKTVKVHRARVVEKMGAASLADLVRMADRLAPLVPSAPRLPMAAVSVA